MVLIIKSKTGFEPFFNVLKKSSEYKKQYGSWTLFIWIELPGNSMWSFKQQLKIYGFKVWFDDI